MRLFIDEVEYNLEAITLSSFNEYWIRETQKLFLQNRYLTSVEINGKQYGEGYESIIVEQFSEINEIIVTTMKEEELVKESIQELYRYNKKLIPACSSIGALFYGEMSDEDWKSFVALMDGVHWIVGQAQGVAAIFGKQNVSTTQTELLSQCADRFVSILKEIEALLQDKEYIQLADVLSYELSEAAAQLDHQLIPMNR